MIDKALLSLHPTASWYMNGDEYEGVVWLSTDIAQPSKEVVLQEVARLRAEAEANQYKQQRVAEYPSIGDQLDALFHAGVFPEAMAAQIQAIKDKYPKS